MRFDWRRWSMVTTFLLMIAALFIVIHVLRHFTWAQIAASLGRIGPWGFVWSALCTAFRIIYFLIPLALGCLLLAGTELRQRIASTKADLRP